MKTYEELLKELEPKTINFKVDRFEELILQDIAQYDEDTRIKLNRDLTKDFNKWITDKLDAKEQVKINIKGETRCHRMNTKVLMSDGTYKKIQDIKMGDSVMSFNETTKIIEPKRVLNTFEYKRQRQKMIRFISLDGFVLDTTNGHKFYYKNKWVTNSELAIRKLGLYSKYEQQLRSKRQRENFNSQLEEHEKNTINETCFRQEWLFENNDYDRWCFSHYKSSSYSCTTFLKEFLEQTSSKPQKSYKVGQSYRKSRMGDTQREHTSYNESRETIKKFWGKERELKTNSKTSRLHKKKVCTSKVYSNNDSKGFERKNCNCKICTLQRLEGREINLDNIYNIKFYETVCDVYDLEVQDNHNYLVSSKNIISHNSGKSLIGLKIMYVTTKQYPEKQFLAKEIVCANQKELRQKLNTVEFGDSKLIDENAFANVGTGSITELQQLKDINNIIAKQNIHMVYITPQVFLLTGATMGLSYYGKDTKNWLSRFLLYSLKGNTPALLGYVIFDVGSLFRDTGCLVYKLTGGCTNPKRLTVDDIPKEYIEFSDCIEDKYKQDLYQSIDLDHTKKTCPFYNVCESQMCVYEHIKDKWIEREMKGGLQEREREKLEVALKLYEQLAELNPETQKVRLQAKNGKELKLKVKMKLPFINNTKYTGVEIDEITQTVFSLIDENFLLDVCKTIEVDGKEFLDKIYSKIT